MSKTTDSKEASQSNPKCVFCGDNASPKVVKDFPYENMLGLIWETLRLEVKFQENSKFDLCAPCFSKVLRFYDLNDACVLMEKHLNEVKNKLIRSNLEGIKKLKDSKKPILDPHIKLETAHQESPVTEVNHIGGYKYEVIVTCEDDPSQSLDSKRSEKDDDQDKGSSTGSTLISFQKQRMGNKRRKSTSSQEKQPVKSTRGKRKAYYSSGSDF